MGFARVSHLRFDPWLVVPTVLLVAIGAVALRSATEGTTFLWRQLIACGIGIALFFLITQASSGVLRRIAYPAYGILLALLVVVLFTEPVRGTRGWFSFGWFQLQPAELMKVGLLLILARYFAAVAPRLSRLSYLLVSGLMMCAPVALILLQPDLGTALVLVVTWLVLLLLSGIKKQFIVLLVVGAVVIGAVGWNIGLQDYQKDRLIAFMNPEADPLGDGYNLIQSKIAIGSGQWFGRGLGHGSQGQLQFLPERHTDFIFAVIGEEMGFVGAVLVIVFMGALFLRGVMIARHASDEFSFMVAAGVVAILAYQACVNIGMNIGLLPVTGVTLPFVSYGGTSMVISWMLIGILQVISTQQRLRGSSLHATKADAIVG